MKKNITIAVLVGAVLSAGGFWVTQPTVQQIIDRGGDNLGALAGPDIPYQYLNVGGVRHEFRSMDFTAATTTPCALNSPAATSTLISFTAHGARTDSAGDTTFDMGIGSTAYATSSTRGTLVSATAWASASQFDLATSSSALIIPPNSFVLIKLSTSTLSTNYAGTGRCMATFQDLQ